jgi:hypothetical protein
MYSIRLFSLVGYIRLTGTIGSVYAAELLTCRRVEEGGEGETRQDKTRQDETRHSLQNRAKQNRTGQDRTGRSNRVQATACKQQEREMKKLRETVQRGIHR